MLRCALTGKWMAVHFNGRAQIAGCRIETYLLEKSRITAQAPDERSYHIFYQMCAALDASTRKELCLSSSAADHRYLASSGCVASEYS